MTEEVFALAKELGHIGQEDEVALRALCGQAEEELRGRLAENVTEADCSAAFRLGAAWLALSLLCAAQTAGGVESFSAGRLTVRYGGAAQRASVMRLQAEQVMKPYLKDGGFVFRGVRG